MELQMLAERLRREFAVNGMVVMSQKRCSNTHKIVHRNTTNSVLVSMFVENGYSKNVLSETPKTDQSEAKRKFNHFTPLISGETDQT